MIDKSRKWWKARNMHGQAAHVPHTIVTLLLQEEDAFTPPASADWSRKPKKGDLRYFWAKQMASLRQSKEKEV